MPNHNRQRGDYFERQTRSALEVAGWLVVRSAGSLGPADLVALRRNSEGATHVLLVSCKVDGRTSPAERAALVDAADRSGSGAEALLARRPDKGVVELVDVTDQRVRATLRAPSRPRATAADVEGEPDAAPPPNP